MSLHANYDILSRMADDMLLPAVQATWKQHLSACLECRIKAEALVRVKQTLQALPSVEINPLEQLHPTVFVPVVRAVFPRWAFLAGLTLGLMLVTALMVLHPFHQSMRFISTAGQLVPGQALNSTSPGASLGDMDLEIPGQLSLRLKPGTTVSWQELDRLWLLGGRTNIVLNVMQGEILARTQDKFWGSHLQVRTPMANALIKGTAFSVKVEPKQDATTLKVLAGSVFLSPYLDKVGLEVRAGQAGRIEGHRIQPKTKSLSAKEKMQLLEAYRIGKSPMAALVVGGGPERVEELFKPALLYVSVDLQSVLQPYVMLRIRELNQAILEGRISSEASKLRILETAALKITDPELAVPLRLFLGACNLQTGYPRRACLHFQWVRMNAPEHPLASLALAAVGRVTGKYLHNPEAAKIYYQEIMAHYSKSPEVEIARAFLHPSAD